MKGFIRPKLVLTLISFVLIAVAAAIPLSQSLFHTNAASPNNHKIEAHNIHGAFFSYPADNGVFDATPSDTPVFTQGFSAFNFNPLASMQKCSNSTGVDDNTRPFTDVFSKANGTCVNTVAQGNGQQAGTGNLSSFEAEFTAAFSLPHAGHLVLNLFVDDGWILSMGPDKNGDQPTYLSGPQNNPPSSGKGAFTGYPVVGANNVSSYAIPMTLEVNIPAAGTYPIELDYTECCGGGLSLVMNSSLTSLTTSYNSVNYAGYASLGANAQSRSFSDVLGSWTVPSIQCVAHPPFPTLEVRTWVGLGGIDTKDLEKVGTGATCSSTLQIQYFAFSQIDSAAMAAIHQQVQPGDNMLAEIHYQTNGMVLFKLSDSTQNWKFTQQVSKSGRVADSAECFIDAPTQHTSGVVVPLATFNTITFSNCSADGKAIDAGPITGMYTLVDGSGNVKATPSALSAGGNAFSITQ